jgi:hypothetical protein
MPELFWDLLSKINEHIVFQGEGILAILRDYLQFLKVLHQCIEKETNYFQKKIRKLESFMKVLSAQCLLAILGFGNFSESLWKDTF